MSSLDIALKAYPPEVRPMVLRAILRQNPKRTQIEGSLIVPGLIQGRAPPCGSLLRQSGIDTIVLCAEEWQPPYQTDPICSYVLGYQPGTHPYPGVELIRAPADDDFERPPSTTALNLASRTAGLVAQRILRGHKVFVSCWMGKNRSGLVTCLTLHGLTGLGGADVLRHLWAKRPEAMTNPQFQAAVAQIRQAPRPSPALV
jgi:hypothetical protein